LWLVLGVKTCSDHSQGKAFGGLNSQTTVFEGGFI